MKIGGTPTLERLIWWSVIPGFSFLLYVLLWAKSPHNITIGGGLISVCIGIAARALIVMLDKRLR